MKKKIKKKSKSKKNEVPKTTPTGARTLVILHEKISEPKIKGMDLKFIGKN